MDGRRLDRILITKLPSADDPKKKEKLRLLKAGGEPALKEAPKIKGDVAKVQRRTISTFPFFYTY